MSPLPAVLTLIMLYSYSEWNQYKKVSGLPLPAMPQRSWPVEKNKEKRKEKLIPILTSSERGQLCCVAFPSTYIQDRQNKETVL
jgi:hypothetical protein